MRGGKVLVTDGPFAETREWIAGFDILECADLDEAIEIASQHPMARFGRLELRPFWDGRRRPDVVTDGGCAAGDVHRALADAMAAERLRIVATLIRTTGDWDLAEDAVADAAERALARWVGDGIPDRPAAWLTTTARRRAIDVLRRRDTERRKLSRGRHARRSGDEPPHRRGSRSTTTACGSIFTCCHPALSMEARVALTLKVVVEPVDGGDRADVPDVREHDGPAAAARQAQDRQRRHPLPRSSRRRRSPNASTACSP